MKEILSDYKGLLLGQGKGPEQFITRSYLLALFIIGMMTMITHGITTKITAAQQTTTEINYNLSRQRANIQQVVLYGKRLQSSKSIIDKEFMTQAINEIEMSYNSLFVKDDERIKENLNSLVLQEFFFNAPYNMDSHLISFVKTAREVAEPPINFTEADVAERLNLVEEQATQRLVRAFDVVHEFYQREAAEKIEKLFKLQSMSVVFIILVLIIEALYIFRPLVIKLSKYHKKLIRLALEDPLTGLNNRRAFISKASNELTRCVDDPKPVSIVLCDLDKFKNINDTYGHNVGDQVLKHFSKLMSSSLRSRDIIGRIGGEEFAIMLPNCDKEEAFMIIDRFRETVANTPCGYDDDDNRKQTLSYTGSFGVIVNEEQDVTVETLLSAADKNLYSAKETGRNKVVASVLVHVPDKKTYNHKDTLVTPDDKTTGAPDYPDPDESIVKKATNKRTNRDKSETDEKKDDQAEKKAAGE